MALVIEIALGILLALIILANLEAILALAALALVVGIGIAILAAVVGLLIYLGVSWQVALIWGIAIPAAGVLLHYQGLPKTPDKRAANNQSNHTTIDSRLESSERLRPEEVRRVVTLSWDEARKAIARYKKPLIVTGLVLVLWVVELIFRFLPLELAALFGLAIAVPLVAVPLLLMRDKAKPRRKSLRESEDGGLGP